MPLLRNSCVAVVALRAATFAAIIAFSAIPDASADVRTSEVIPIESATPSTDQKARMVSWANGVALRSAISFRGNDERLYRISELVHGYYPGRTTEGELIIFKGDPWNSSQAVVVRGRGDPINVARPLPAKSNCPPTFAGYALRSQGLSHYGVFVGVWRRTNPELPYKSMVALFSKHCPPGKEANADVVLKSNVDWRLAFIQPHLHVGSSLLLLSDARQGEFITFAVYNLESSRLRFLTPPQKKR